MEISDATLVEAYLAGDKGAFDILTMRYLKSVHMLAFHYAKNVPDAEDIAQDAFLKALRHIKRFDTVKPFKPWILQITRNQALDWLKKKKPHVFSAIEEEGESILDLIPDPGPLPDAMARLAEEKAGLMATLKDLTSNERKLLFFRYIKGFSFKEISEELHEVIDTVKSRHRRLMLRLRKNLAKAETWD